MVVSVCLIADNYLPSLLGGKTPSVLSPSLRFRVITYLALDYSGYHGKPFLIID